MNFNISMTTYYMPSKNLEIPLKEIKWSQKIGP
jgi:hypothetical protein